MGNCNDISKTAIIAFRKRHTVLETLNADKLVTHFRFHLIHTEDL